MTRRKSGQSPQPVQDLAQAGRRDPLHGQASLCAEQAAGPGDPGRLGPQGACRRHAGSARSSRRPYGPSWCIAWTAIPPACCWWRARRRRPRVFRGRWPAATPPKSIGRWSRACRKRSAASIKAALAKEGGAAAGATSAWRSSEDDDAKFALTEYAVMGTGGPGIRLGGGAGRSPGRTHQIRVHLASLGTPIVGDFKYGGTDARGQRRDRRQAASACPLASTSPVPMAGGCRSPRLCRRIW